MKKKLTYLLLVAISIIYHISPVDLISDIIPLIGQIDDVVVALVPLIMGYKNISSKS